MLGAGSEKKVILPLWVALSVSIVLSACAKKPEPVPVWSFESGGIRIRYSADRQLNVVDGKAHTLVLVVYQLDNLNGFNQFAGYPDGIRKLLKAGSFDPSVMAVERTFVEPDRQDQLVLNRAEKAKWIAVVAGYYNMAPGKVARTYEIPYKVESRGWIFKTREARIEPINLDLTLGPQSIEELKAR
jgi:type VI secretion system VasD/TssJ family lipoprotein